MRSWQVFAAYPESAGLSPVSSDGQVTQAPVLGSTFCSASFSAPQSDSQRWAPDWCWTKQTTMVTPDTYTSHQSVCPGHCGGRGSAGAWQGHTPGVQSGLPPWCQLPQGMLHWTGAHSQDSPHRGHQKEDIATSVPRTAGNVRGRGEELSVVND